MAFTSNIEWFIGIQDDGQLELRRSKVVYEDGEEIARNHLREVLVPGQNVSSYPAKVRQIAQLIWTPAVIAAYEAKKAAAQSKTPR